MEFVGPFTSQLATKLDYALSTILIQNADPKAPSTKPKQRPWHRFGGGEDIRSLNRSSLYEVLPKCAIA